MSDVSPGEVGGMFAGALAAAIAVGHGARWVLGFTDRRAQRRENSIDEHEREYRDRIDRRLDEMVARDAKRQAENLALRLAFELVASALRAHDPGNLALLQAERILTKAFPVDPFIPADMVQQLEEIDRRSRGEAA